MKISSYKDLIVWQKSMDLVSSIYDLTDLFPKKEMYCLSDQMRRCSISIPSNIAEGSRRGSKADFRKFLYYSYGSGAELETQLEISRRRMYGELKKYKEMNACLNEIMRMLNGLIRSL
jgi:four helix bundle protein